MDDKDIATLNEVERRMALLSFTEREQVARFLLNTLNTPIRRFIIPLPNGRHPYLERFILDEGDQSLPKDQRSKTYLHLIYESDGDRDPHDHPFDFESRIVWGSYRETTYELGCVSPVHIGTAMVSGKLVCVACGMDAVKPWHKEPQVFKQGDVNVKKAAQLHKLEVIQGPVVTLVRRGPKVRKWGFQTDQGWVHHEPYIREKFPGAQPTEVD